MEGEKEGTVVALVALVAKEAKGARLGAHNHHNPSHADNCCPTSRDRHRRNIRRRCLSAVEVHIEAYRLPTGSRSCTETKCSGAGAAVRPARTKSANAAWPF
eukprot:4192382-Prymnesium_polylepis.1